MLTKSVAVKVKATAADDTALEDGQFTALASVFNNVDDVGDVVLPGAFSDDLAAWKASGDVIPLYWGHRMDSPDMCIGSVVEAKETDTGLHVKAALDLDNPNAAQVYRLLKGRRVSRMSFAYDVVDGGAVERDGQHVYELRKLKIHEVSVVQVPANPDAAVQEVKRAARIPDAAPSTQDTAATKAGRVLSAKNETALKGALEKIAAGVTDIKSVLTALDSNDNDNEDSNDGKASPTQPADTEEPAGAKVHEPARSRPASLRLRTGLAALAAEVSTLTN